ncbi:hypothetical protein NQ317_012236 [Molorchus minor]|uniref:Uncharacterized protein n=1 Tax=Molorchus minor TaxID=1323400 RepID=A0ABQ9J1B9_9CUCU|nr:hypothetical protein NQ317_012236 [Molorchus minor]
MNSMTDIVNSDFAVPLIFKNSRRLTIFITSALAFACSSGVNLLTVKAILWKNVEIAGSSNGLEGLHNSFIRASLPSRYMGKGESFRSLAFQFRIHHSWVSKIVTGVLESIKHRMVGIYR